MMVILNQKYYPNIWKLMILNMKAEDVWKLLKVTQKPLNWVVTQYNIDNIVVLSLGTFLIQWNYCSVMVVQWWLYRCKTSILDFGPFVSWNYNNQCVLLFSLLEEIV